MPCPLDEKTIFLYFTLTSGPTFKVDVPQLKATLGKECRGGNYVQIPVWVCGDKTKEIAEKISLIIQKIRDFRRIAEKISAIAQKLPNFQGIWVISGKILR